METQVATIIHDPTQVSFGITMLFSGILVLMILSLALEEKLHASKSLIVGVFAVIALFLGELFHLLPIGAVVNIFNEKINLPVFIPAVDWTVIAIILGSGVFVDVISKSGLFSWIAIKLTKMSKGDPVTLLYYYCAMTVIFSAVLNNVTAMIIVGSLSAVSLNKLGKKDLLLGFLLTEGLLTNIGGLLTLISSVPNIIVGNIAGISFIKFFLVSSPFVVISTIITVFMGSKIFKIERLKNEEKSVALKLVSSFDENDGIESNSFFWFGTVMITLFILVIATTSIIPYIKELGMGYVALSFAVISLIRFKSEVDRFYKAIDWDLIGFFMALFVVINVMEHAQVLALIGKGIVKVIALGPQLGTAAVLAGSAIFSSVTDNIPLSAMLAKILANLGTESSSSLWWAIIFGSNLGGNLTPIGSASTLVAVTIIHKNNIKLSFIDFVKKAFPFALVQIILAIVYVVMIL